VGGAREREPHKGWVSGRLKSFLRAGREKAGDLLDLYGCQGELSPPA
jgi:hypothetical protein